MKCRGRTTGVNGGLFRLPLLVISRVYLVVLCLPASLSAQQTLVCGDSLRGSVAGRADSYRLRVAAGATGFLQISRTSGDAELLRMVLTGDGVDIDTCSGVTTFRSRGGVVNLSVSPCLGGSADYTLNLEVVSESPSHCGYDLSCGATPDGFGLAELGEVDSFRFSGVVGEPVTLRMNDLDSREDAYLVRVYNPDGESIVRTCSDEVEVVPEASGVYTLLVSACGRQGTAGYRIEREDRFCPSGPVITSMAFLPGDRSFAEPAHLDPSGRAVYLSNGRGTLIVEGRVGRSLRGIDASAFTPGELPALQVIVSEPLGDGSPEVCDRGARPPGGVPATNPFGFRRDRRSIDRINDFGCRIDDGAGIAVGRRDPLNSCLRFLPGFADPTSVIQFCGDITSAESVPEGDTVIAARLRDLDDNLGAVREIVVRVPTTQPTPTFTEAPSMTTPTPPPATPTPTREPTEPPPTREPGPCTCDCNLNGRVRVGELIRCVSIALGQATLGQCRNADVDGDLMVSIAELIQGVRNALNGCPPSPPEV